MSDQSAFAERALAALAAMQGAFRRRDGLYRRDGWPRRPGAAAHLWPFARALVATLDVAGIDPTGAVWQAVDKTVPELDRYRDPCGAYGSDPAGRRAPDVYYDDNAWVGLALAQLERMRPGSGWLPRAAELYAFATGGWDRRPDVRNPGGVFWLLQERGLGRRNHDRNTVSTAPNAALGLHLRELGAPPPARAQASPEQMYAWVNATFDNGSGVPGEGLFWDKVRGDGSLDRTIWSYNQGNMVALNVLLARGTTGSQRGLYIGRAEAIGRRALERWGSHWESQPAAFNAILFRNLLMLYGLTSDAELRARIVSQLRGYGELAWQRWRDRRNVFRFPGGGGATLLGQSAAVQILALSAWDPERYVLLA